MLSILKRLPVLPQRLHVTGEPRTWFAFPLPAPLPPSGPSADPESAPGGGGGGASGVGDPAVSGAGGVAAAGLRCAARIALARPASFCAFVLRVMPDEKPGNGGRAQAEPLWRASQWIVPTILYFVLRTPCFALRAS